MQFNHPNQHEGDSAEEYITCLWNLVDSSTQGQQIWDDPWSASHGYQRQLAISALTDRCSIDTRKGKDSHPTAQSCSGATAHPISWWQVWSAICDQLRQEEVNSETRRSISTAACVEATTTSSNSKPWPLSKCTRCGISPHLWQQCPAKDAVCFSCKKKEHFSGQCFSKREATQVSEITEDLPVAYLNTISFSEPGAHVHQVDQEQR